MCPRILITFGPIKAKKIGSKVKMISHNDSMSAEKPLSWNVLVLQLLKKPAPSFLPESLILAWIEAEWMAQQKYREFFFNFRMELNIDF